MRPICGSILEAEPEHPEVLPNFLAEAIQRMPSEPLSDTPPASDGDPTPGSPDSATLPVDLSEFSQRLASFGLGETPDPLLTESRPPAKRRLST